jgi:hypothetical protein
MAASPSTGIGANKRGAAGQLLALIGAAIALAVVVALIVTWPAGGGSSSGAPSPAARHGLKPAAAVSLSAAAIHRRR